MRMRSGDSTDSNNTTPTETRHMNYEELRDALKQMQPDLSYKQARELEVILNDRMTAEQITAMGEVEFDCPSFHGLEFRGLLGQIVKSLEVKRSGELSYNIRFVYQTTCVNTGAKDREIVFEGPLTLNDAPRPMVNGVELTNEQTIVCNAVKYLMTHEVEESIRLNGVHVREPTHDFSGAKFEW